MTISGASKELSPSGAGDPRRRNARSHEAILVATSELMAEVGYARLTIEGVAARAGVGKATVYRWWPSKAALTIEAMSRQLDSPLPAETGDLRRDLLDAIRRAIHVLARSPERALIPALAADLIRDPALAAQFRDQILRPRRSRVIAILRNAVDRGELPANVDIDLLMDVYVGAVLYRVVVSGKPVDETLAQQLVSLLLDGKQPVMPGAD
jgi:AcrR family transcriptional regulator